MDSEFLDLKAAEAVFFCYLSGVSVGVNINSCGVLSLSLFLVIKLV